MPTKRTRRTRTRRDLRAPEWAIRLRDHGELPGRNSDAYSEYVCWHFFDEHVPGLPDHWRKKERLISEAEQVKTPG